MKFNFYAKSDIGAVRSSNQDSVFARSRSTRAGRAFLGIVCDGMGGLSDGEFASKTVVDLFSNWFSKELKQTLLSDDLFGELCSQWSALMCRARAVFSEHIGDSDKVMGTTLSVLLIIGGQYYAAQVGDSRIYLYRNGTALQITSDHSYVAELAQKGLMTYDEASVAPNKNILTRCIGNMCEFSPDFYTGEVFAGDCFFLSSDGFHGGIIASGINEILGYIFSADGRIMRKRLDEQIVKKMKSGESDNITAVCLKVIKL